MHDLAAMTVSLHRLRREFELDRKVVGYASIITTSMLRKQVNGAHYETEFGAG